MVDQAGPSFIKSTRFMMAIVGFFGCAVVYSLRVNLSVAIVCMVNQTWLTERALAEEAAKLGNYSILNINDTMALMNVTHVTTMSPRGKDECVGQVEDNATDTSKVGSFEWDKTTQGRILSCFFWGYLCTQILGGWLAQRFGGKKILFGNVLVSTVCSLLTPAVLKLGDKRGGTELLMALRVLMGFAQGSTFPGFHTLWSHWSPPVERGKLCGFTYAGLQVGNVLTMAISGWLCENGFDGGWPSIFYLLGATGVIWMAVWWFYASDTPQSHGKISPTEREYITCSLSHDMGGHDEKGGQGSVPWFQIAKSLPVWACFAGHFAGDWGAYLMLTQLPSFLNDVLKFKMTSLGFAAIPYIAYFICINLAGGVADTLIHRKILSTVNVRRLMMIIALMSQAVFLVAAGFCKCGQEMIVIALLTIGTGLSGFQYAGFIVSYMEVAPRYAGPIVGVGNTLSCLAGIIAPELVGAMTKNKTPEEWRSVFYITAAVLIFGTVFFCIFIKGEVQPWALASKDPRSHEMVRLEPLDDETRKGLVHHEEEHEKARYA